VNWIDESLADVKAIWRRFRQSVLRLPIIVYVYKNVIYFVRYCYFQKVFLFRLVRKTIQLLSGFGQIITCDFAPFTPGTGMAPLMRR
jgi:hypothetical protein